MAILDSPILTYTLILFLAGIAFGPVLLRIYQRSFDLAEPAIWFSLFYFLHFGVRALYDMNLGTKFFEPAAGTAELAQIINPALIVSIIALTTFWVGYLKPTQARAELPAKWKKERVFPVAVGCLAIGWAVRAGMMILQAGSVTGWIFADKGKLLMFPGYAYIKLVQLLIPAAGVLIAFIGYYLYQERRYLAIFVVSVVPEILFRLISGKRSWMLFFPAGLFMAYYLINRGGVRKNLKITAQGILLVVGSVPLFAIVTTMRRVGAGKLTEALVAITRPSTIVSTSKLIGERLHGLDSLALIMRAVPEHVSYTYFSELLLIPVAVVPRAIWADKPIINLGIRFNHVMVEFAKTDVRAIAVTLPGQFYWDLGLIGVIIGMFFVGILWKIMYEYLVRPQENYSNILLISALFPTFFMPVEQTLVSLFTWHLFQLGLMLTIVLSLTWSAGNRQLIQRPIGSGE